MLPTHSLSAMPTTIPYNMIRSLRAAVIFLVCASSAPSPLSANLDYFTGHFRCPFSKLWVEHGPDRAAEILGVSGHLDMDSRRSLLAAHAGAPFGSCSYLNGFTQQETCVEFRGSGWTEETASARCSTVGRPARKAGIYPSAQTI